MSLGSAPHMGGSGGVPGPWVLPGPALASVAVWELNQSQEELLFSVSVSQPSR